MALSIDDAEKFIVLNKQELDEVDQSFSLNALRVLASRYLIRDKKGKIIESPKACFERIAILVGLGDLMHDTWFFDKDPGYGCGLSEADVYSYARKYEGIKVGQYVLNEYHREAMARFFWANKEHFRLSIWEILDSIKLGDCDKYEKNIKEYYNLMVSKTFLPNSPTIMNAGAKLGQLSACFVLGIDDNLESIMQTAKDTAFIFKSGGGVGINYSNLRAENAIVASTSGVASGPVSFMGIIDKITDVIKQGGKRRGANMGILESTHPDIKKFVTAKRTKGVLENFNVSVAMWGHPEKDTELFDLITESAHASAEPGVIFLDHVNAHNPLEKARGKPLTTTNPCGEQSLYPFESCNLGSINLAEFVKDGEFDWYEFIDVIKLCTQFLDNIVDMNKYPLPAIEKAAYETRRIGLGVMGLSEALIKLGIQYNSKEGYQFMEKAAEILTYESMLKSVWLSEKRGAFGLFNTSGYLTGIIPVSSAYSKSPTLCKWFDLIQLIREKGIRNSYCTTVAPTGSLSMIADTSSGIEPTFALAFIKKVAVGTFTFKNEYLQKELEKRGLDIPEIWQKIADNRGSIQNIKEIPDELKPRFMTSFDLSTRDHVMAQAVWQKWINNAISKTINMPESATVDEVKEAYRLAYDVGLKGITVYRDHSRHNQVIYV